MKKFTFKKEPREGKYRSFLIKQTTIKLDKKEIGYIVNPLDGKWKIRLAIKKGKTKQDPAPFKWITLKKRFDSEEAARTFLQEKAEQIQAGYNLHKFDD